MKRLMFLMGTALILMSCKKETCGDGIQNQDETGIDCGGACTACESCTDGILNQDETGIDCGGVCPACPSVVYPDLVWGYPNYLRPDITVYSGPGTAGEGLSAEFYNGGSVAVHFTGASSYSFGLVNGWDISGVGTENLWMVSTDPDYAVAEFWMSATGSANFEYFENGADTAGSPTFSKVFSW